MSFNKIHRREFLKVAGTSAAACGISGSFVRAVQIQKPAQSTIHRWREFNLLDYFTPAPGRGANRAKTTEDDFRWMSDWGFDFVRPPMTYPRFPEHLEI